ncbi:Dynein intermediate chain 3, ciliary [Dufourea novaeangliae]|uniref:Dynein intermediate chain 3, ciliary n=1 Tax=Dufourea novaeangliae TaxID=178035 RepID=A0A154P158_DUFNO|nr:Dynein intermediate chain 3, ciliary [Dufourea novaeangliae]
MELKKVYVKKRTDFGKQCMFDLTDPVLDVNMYPNPSDMRDYIMRTHCHIRAQKSTQLAGHKVSSTDGATSRNSGMCHFEGGWPKEINPRDEETVMRFRRRVEKDDNWAPKLHNLFGPMEDCILQNGTLNIYDHYFDDMVPTELVQPLSLRSVKNFEDPETPRRPVTNISWSPDNGNRILVSYCFLEYGKRTDNCNRVYVWQVDNPTEPYMAMESFYACVACEYNPRDPSVVAGGLMNGQVCYWDLRTDTKPIGYSNLLYSHRDYVNAVKWIQSKSNSEFYSSSADGRAMWWDTRWLRRPTDMLIFDLEKPNDPNLDRTIGVSCLNFGPVPGTKFLFGLDNGIVVSGTRKAKTNAEKLAIKFDAHAGPVVFVDRNVFNPNIFLSIGDWTVKIWSEDTKEGCLLSTLYMRNSPTISCWNKTRNSVFYVATDNGTLIAWDLLRKLQKPIFKLQLGKDKITSMAPDDDGTYMAVGNYNGSVYLVEPTEYFHSFEKRDRIALSEFIERYSKLTKAVDVRLKEIRLMQKMTVMKVEKVAESSAQAVVKVKEKKRKERDSKEAGKSKSGKDGKRSPRESKKKAKDDVTTVYLTAVENKYYEMVEQELQKYARESKPELRPSGPTQIATKKQDRKAKSKRDEETKEAHKKTAKRNLDRKRKTLTRQKSSRRSTGDMPAFLGDGVIEEPDVETQEKLSTKKTKQMVKFLLPVPCKTQICKPKVCCFRNRRKKRATKSNRDKKLRTKSSSVLRTKSPSASTLTAQSKYGSGRRNPKFQALVRWKMLDLPVELMREVQRAKREIRDTRWSRAGSRRRHVDEITEEDTGRHSGSTLSDRTVDSDHGDSSVDDAEGGKEPFVDSERKRKIVTVDPCILPKGKSIEKDFSSMIGVSMPSSIEKEVVVWKSYLGEREAVQGRIYPRISEFHTIE